MLSIAARDITTMSDPLPLPPLRQALPDLASWVAFFSAAEIPVLAETADHLELMRANEDAADANNLGEMMGSDPLMSLKVLAHVAQQRAGQASSHVQTDAETVIAALVLMGITPFFRAFGPQAVVEERLALQPWALEGLQRVLRRADRAAHMALSFAVHRLDPDAPVIHSAALLHDFAEMLMWVHAPELAQEMRRRQLADPQLRSAEVQRQVLNIELADLERALLREWHLPELLQNIIDDTREHDPQVQCVKLAIRVARHTADGWDNEAVPDDVCEIADLLKLGNQATLNLLHEFD